MITEERFEMTDQVVTKVSRKAQALLDIAPYRGVVQWIVVDGKATFLHIADCPHYTQPRKWRAATPAESSLKPICSDCGRAALPYAEWLKAEQEWKASEAAKAEAEAAAKAAKPKPQRKPRKAAASKAAAAAPVVEDIPPTESSDEAAESEPVTAVA